MDIISGLFPRTCPICGKVLEYGGDLICSKCRQKLPYIVGSRCMKCGKGVENAEIEYCYDCTRRKHIYDKGTGLFSYSDEIRKSIYNFKYNNKREYAKFYGAEIARCLGNEIRSWNADMIVPVPLHSSKLIKRGYNQAHILANEIGKNLGIPVKKDVLERTVNTKPQKELNDEDRKKNVERAFKIHKNIVKLKNIIIVDDIYTTGSTIDGCASVLKMNGADKVYYISLSIGTGF